MQKPDDGNAYFRVTRRYEQREMICRWFRSFQKSCISDRPSIFGYVSSDSWPKNFLLKISRSKSKELHNNQSLLLPLSRVLWKKGVFPSEE
jgi:hypothetical protein